MIVDANRSELNRLNPERTSLQKVKRRTAISLGLAAVGIYTFPFITSNNAFAQESEWTTQDLVTSETKVISEGGILEPGSAIKIAPISEFQVPLNSPVTFRMTLDVTPSEGNTLARTSGGVLISKDPFPVYDPEQTSWLGVLFFRELYGVGQDRGEGTKNGRSFPEEFQTPTQDLAILLDETGKNATVSLGDKSKTIFETYPIERPLLNTVSGARSLYIAAYSRPGSKTTVDRLSISYKTSVGK